jgi:cysteine-rich repeat protein
VTTKDEITIIQARPICGNASLEEGEACDDNNTDNQDGCDEKCNREIRGIECNNLPANAVANAAIAIIQGCTVSNGISCQQREPTTSYQYSTSPSTHECFFDCKQ